MVLATKGSAFGLAQQLQKYLLLLLNGRKTVGSDFRAEVYPPFNDISNQWDISFLRCDDCLLDVYWMLADKK